MLFWYKVDTSYQSSRTSDVSSNLRFNSVNMGVLECIAYSEEQKNFILLSNGVLIYKLRLTLYHVIQISLHILVSPSNEIMTFVLGDLQRSLHFLEYPDNESSPRDLYGKQKQQRSFLKSTNAYWTNSTQERDELSDYEVTLSSQKKKKEEESSSTPSSGNASDVKVLRILRPRQHRLFPYPSISLIIDTLLRCRFNGCKANLSHIYDYLSKCGLITHKSIGNYLLPVLSKMSTSQYVFDTPGNEETINYDSIIEDNLKQGKVKQTLSFFREMQKYNLTLLRKTTLVALLKACTKVRDLETGSEIHALINQSISLQTDLFVGSALVDMYAKCSSTDLAQNVFDKIPMKDVVLWTALISGYAEYDDGEKALKYFDTMQLQGLCPNAVTYICSLKACTNLHALGKGLQLHAQVLGEGFLGRDTILGNTLLAMYAKVGMLDMAQKLFQMLGSRDVVSWTTLISGHVEHGYDEDALKFFEEMQLQGLSPNSITLACSLKSCGRIGGLEKGQEVHSEIERLGPCKFDINVGSRIVDMYMKCGTLRFAKETFAKFPFHTPLSWTAIMTGHIENGQCPKALKCYEQLLVEGISPDTIIFGLAMKACGSIGSVNKGQFIHAQIEGMLFKKDSFIVSMLIEMYFKFSRMTKACHAFEKLEFKDVTSWTSLVGVYMEHGHYEEALQCIEHVQREGMYLDDVLLMHTMKACGSLHDLIKGLEAHSDIEKRGLLNGDSIFGNALIDMYAKCGSLNLAEHLFDKLLVRDVVTWTTLISGYMEQGYAEDALKHFEVMQLEGVNPNDVTVACIFKACGTIKFICKGCELHSYIEKMGLSVNNMILCTALISMYAKFGWFLDAQNMLYKLTNPDPVCWTLLLNSYVDHGFNEEALSYIDEMQQIGVSLNSVTYICALKACRDLLATHKGLEIHADIERKKTLQFDHILCNALVDMYATCGCLEKGVEVFHEICDHDVTSWNVLISGFVSHGYNEEALKYIEKMQIKGFLQNAVTYICSLKACGDSGDLWKGEQIHSKIESSMLISNDISVRNTLIDMYVKCGSLTKVQEVFNELPSRDFVSWNALIEAYIENGDNEEALKCLNQMQQDGVTPDVVSFMHGLRASGSLGEIGQGMEIHAEIVRNGFLEWDHVVATALVDMYGHCRLLSKANEVFNNLPFRNTVLWNTLITSYSEHGYGTVAIKYFENMQLEGILPNAITFVSILKSCSITGALDRGQQVHSKLRGNGLETDLFICNSLIDMYAKCGSVDISQKILDKLKTRDVISWTALMDGYAQYGHVEEAIRCFEKMQLEGICPNSVTFLLGMKACSSKEMTEMGQEIHAEIQRKGLLEKRITVGNSLLDMYAKCGLLSIARNIFDMMPVKDVVSWTILIAGLVEKGFSKEALTYFEQMQTSDVSPNVITLVCILKACGEVGDLEKGNGIHLELERMGLLETNIIVGTTLIGMYAKCGMLAKAQQVFNNMPSRDVVSWNSLIGGYTEQGHGEKTLVYFEKLQLEGLNPSPVTFVCCLKACGDTVAIEKGYELHAEIEKKGLQESDTFVGNTLVDMYAKFGFLPTAQKVFDNLPLHDVISWNSLLAGYAQLGETHSFFDAFERMTSENIKPDWITFVIVLNACSRSCLFHKSQMYFETMSRDFGIMPRREHHNGMIDLLCRAGQLDVAVSLLTRMPFSPDLVTWSSVLGGCVTLGNLEIGKQAYKQIKISSETKCVGRTL